MKLISIALVAAFLLTGCNLNTEQKQEKSVSSSSTLSSSKKSPEDAIFGVLPATRLK